MTTIVNLTPHPVVIAGHTYEPAGPAPRCATDSTPTDPIKVGDVEIPVETISVGAVSGLPDPQPDTIYIVARMVAEAAPHRRDLCIPHRLERDAAGNVIGCAALGQVPTRITE